MLNRVDFDTQFRKSQRRFDFMFRLISAAIAVVFVAIIGFWIFAGTMLFKAAGAVEEVGVKGVIEQVWCGSKNQDCLKGVDTLPK